MLTIMGTVVALKLLCVILALLLGVGSLLAVMVAALARLGLGLRQRATSRAGEVTP